MKVLILAGGFATRLWPVTERRAKPLLLINGKTILHHLMDGLGNVKKEDIIILTNQRFEADFRTELKKIGADKAQIFIEDAQNDGAKLGALKAVSYCIEHFKIKEDIAILAGDNILTDFHIDYLKVEPNQARIMVREVESLHEARKFGVLEMNQEGVVTSFAEKPDQPKSKMVSTGFMSLGSGLFGVLENFIKDQPDNLGGIFAHILSLPKDENHFTIFAHQSKGEWFDIGSFDTYLEAHTKLQQVSVLKNAEVEESGNTFSGKVAISGGAKVKNCVIVDSIIYPNVVLEDCQLSRCVIDENTTLKGVDLNHKIVRHDTRLEAL